MQYLLTPYAERMEPWVWWEGAFSDSELDIIQAMAIKANSQAQVGGGMQGDELAKIRRSRVDWLENSNETQWIFERLAHIASSLNSQYYRFDLTGFGELLQLTNYDNSEHGMYEWHQDYGGANSVSRKLSLVLQLTDPSQYEGGNLEVLTGKDTQQVRKQRGLVAVFPSYVLHRVTPVTSGSRQTLVAWVSGPAFR